MDELALVRWIGGHRAAVLDGLAWLLGQSGRHGALWIALALAGWGFRRVKLAAVWQVVLAAALALVLATCVIKPLVERDRPHMQDAAVRVVGPLPETSSFPSGHAAAAFAAAVALARAWPGGTLVWWCLATVMALSRVYAGAHFPTDILAGAILGWLAGRLVVAKTSWYSLRSVSRTSGVAR